ncbi:LOW QUALITY PROTEIN: deleted in malignant brain tumors 1 protein-like [Strongylocentrotus purpuratus]|uniref:SRCR domain-containing protein n=1 Tax=Strongylocentrotus purpuratus TaxID=7668 RepID=A0A7M7P916_STRPU|nr:LOW QUALITY PROTEIN: deleted in malignant brain tumors 1 protein-like [Strongylocentrotus purpuratus]
MSTTDSATSHPTTTTQSTTTQDTTTTATTESATSHPSTTIESTTTQDATTMSTTDSATSHPTTTTQSTATQDATSHPSTTTHEIEGGIRLVDGYSSDEGRVEIFHEGQWGTVCDYSWDDSDAMVVCRQLGYSGDVGVARSGATYGQGSGPIYLDGVGCSGNESRLTDCSNGGWDNHDCHHYEDAGVYCGEVLFRLVDGYSSDEGRVEISFHEGQWGTVCDDSWDDSDARVVCRQLGYSGNVGVARSGATYGQGSGPIYLDGVGCSGNESRLTDCSNGGWDNHDCHHYEDAGFTVEVLFRLVDGYSSDEGRVEISFHEGQWGTVCDDSWDDSDARVVCRQLGYSGNVGVARSYLDGVGCSGNESRLTDCSNGGWDNHDCHHYEDAGVYCGEVLFRLVDGYSSDEGRVEISFHEGQWGTVCDDSWDDSDARVVCRQLGYSGNVGVARSGATYGQGSGPIYLDGVGCSGNESRLTDCSNGGWDNHDCHHYEDAGVYCGEVLFRLVDGYSSDEGRVEISFHEGQWGRQSVMTVGMTLMRGWFVDSLDTQAMLV